VALLCGCAVGDGEGAGLMEEAPPEEESASPPPPPRPECNEVVDWYIPPAKERL